MIMRNKKLLSILLCLALVVSLAPAVFAADGGNVISGEYTYCPSMGIMGIPNQTGTFTYSDDYFSGNGYDVTKDLTVISMNFTQASFGKQGVAHENQSDNQRDFLEKCGFTGYQCNDFFKSATTFDSMAVGGANKKLADGTTLVAIGARGHNYFKEWAGDVRAGLDGNWEGFQIAADQILDFVKTYIKDQGITGTIKLWMIGYSRSAIATNIAAAAIDDGAKIGNVNLPRENMFIYTYETPEGVVDPNCRAAKYNNIHNIINPNDLVPHVPLTAWGFDRYGEDLFVPQAHTDANYPALRDAMLVELNKVPLGQPYLHDLFQMVSLDPSKMQLAGDGKITQIEYYAMLEEALAKVIPDRQTFYKYQDDLMELMGTLLGNENSQFVDAVMIFLNKLPTAANVIVSAGMAGEEPLVDVVANLLFDSLREAGVSNYNFAQIRAMLANSAPLLVGLITTAPTEVITLLANVMTILTAHFSEIGIAWLRALPDDYLANQSHGSGKPAYLAPFVDVPANAWCAAPIKNVYEKGIMAGTSATTFEPNSTVTRGMIAQILYAEAGKPAVSGSNPFKDVKKGDWYYDAVLWANANKVAVGFDDGTFKPNAAVTREQIAVILCACAGGGATADLSKYSDASEISSWAKTGMQYAVGAGLIAGRGNNKLAPKATATRAEVAQIMTNFIK